MKPIKVYGREQCPYCVKVKQFFANKGWEHEYIDLTGKPDELASLVEKTNFRTVPQVFIGEEFFQSLINLICA